jgi:hypothetical protein
MDEHTLFQLFLLHASEKTQQALISYTIEYLKWRYGVTTLEEMKIALTRVNQDVLPLDSEKKEPESEEHA